MNLTFGLFKEKAVSEQLIVLRGLSVGIQLYKDFSKLGKMSHKARILGDHVVADFVKDVRLDDLLGLHCAMSYVSTMSTLAIEMDPKGPESIMIVSCLSSILGPILASDTGYELDQLIEKMRLLFDGYLMGEKDIYVCQPIGLHSSKVSKLTQILELRFRVRHVLFI